MALIASSASRRSCNVHGLLRGRNPATSALSAASACRSTTGICDLPPASPRHGANRPTCRSPLTGTMQASYPVGFERAPNQNARRPLLHARARYRGAKSAVICPDYSEASKFGDIWLPVKQGTDSALAMAMGHVILTEYHVKRRSDTSRTMFASTRTCRCSSVWWNRMAGWYRSVFCALRFREEPRRVQ